MPGQLLMVGTSDRLNQTSTNVKLLTEFKHIIIIIPQVTASEKGQVHHVNLSKYLKLLNCNQRKIVVIMGRGRTIFASSR